MNGLPSIRWNRKAASVERSDALIERVMTGWRAKRDTAQIASDLAEQESVVATALRIGRELERA